MRYSIVIVYLALVASCGSNPESGEPLPGRNQTSSFNADAVSKPTSRTKKAQSMEEAAQILVESLGRSIDRPTFPRLACFPFLPLNVEGLTIEAQKPLGQRLGKLVEDQFRETNRVEIVDSVQLEQAFGDLGVAAGHWIDDPSFGFDLTVADLVVVGTVVIDEEIEIHARLIDASGVALEHSNVRLTSD